MSTETPTVKALDDLYGYNIHAFSQLQRFGLFIIGAISALFIIYSLVISIKIARIFAHGKTFSLPSARLFTQLKTIVLWWGLYNLAQITFSYIILMPKMDKNMMVMGLCWMFFFHLMLYVLIAAIAAVIRRGAKLQDDHDLTV